MQKIDELTFQIKDAIRESFEYKEYVRLNELIDRDPEVRQRVDEFRRENFRINNSGEETDVISAGELLDGRYKDLREIDYVVQYLQAEICICRMVSEICRNIVDAVDMDMDFL